MSGKELDNLFRNKLEELETTPSAQSWDKLQSGLAGQQKKIKYPYWRFAAAILLLVSFGCIFLWHSEEMADNIMANTDNIETTDTLRKGENVEALSNKTTQEEDTAKSLRKEMNNLALVQEPVEEVLSSKKGKVQKAQESQQANIAEEERLRTDNDESLSNVEMQEEDEAVTVTAGKVSDQVEMPIKSTVLDITKESDVQKVAKNNETDATIAANETSSEQEVEKRKSTALVFDIEEFDKKTAVAGLNEEGQAEVKQSKFKKILNFVKSVKEGDGGMAGLREAKDDLFSFDSKKGENDSE